MARRFETAYRVKRGHDLGEPDYWNRRFEDIDRRVAKNEDDLENIDEVADRVEGVALDRINNVLTPLVAQTKAKLTEIGNLFRSSSASTVAIGTGSKTFVLIDEDRETFAAVEWVVAHPVGDDAVGVVGRVISLDRATGTLVVDAVKAFGTGTHSNWTISISPPYDLTDVSGAISEIRGGVASNRDTLKEVSDALNAVETALDTRLDAVEAALPGKASTAHNHAISDVTGLAGALADKADDADVSALNTRVTGLETAALTRGKALGLAIALGG